MGGHHLRAFAGAVLCILPHHLLASQYLSGLHIHVAPFDLEKPKDGSKPPPGFAWLVSVGTRPWSPGLPDYKACALSSWSFSIGKYSDELPCRGVKKSADGGTQTREPGVAGQDRGGFCAELRVTESPQWLSTIGRGACEQGSCPGFQSSLQVPRTPPAHVARLPGVSVGLFP